jgi:hypothetical protein
MGVRVFLRQAAVQHELRLGSTAQTSRAMSSATSRQDPVALAREVARLRTQLHEARKELRASKLALRATRADTAATLGRDDVSEGPNSSTPSRRSRSITDELVSSSRVRRRFRILALDGGGVRGLFTAQVLARLVKEEPRLLDNVDLIAGTSTGAVIGARPATVLRIGLVVTVVPCAQRINLTTWATKNISARHVAGF